MKQKTRIKAKFMIEKKLLLKVTLSKHYFVFLKYYPFIICGLVVI